MREMLAAFLFTSIMLTGCSKAIDTQMNSFHYKVSTIKSDVEKDYLLVTTSR
jgi:outer membrane murein-binding lipoprotein Lpp